MTQASRAHARRLVEWGAAKAGISFDCGAEDELLEYNRELHALMDEIGLDHHYAEHPGDYTGITGMNTCVKRSRSIMCSV